MIGYFGITHPSWYQRLLRNHEPCDANFWRPSPTRINLDVGTPFFFKLKAPYHAVAGFGYFAGFSVLPDWLAWETFGEANGVGSQAELQQRLRSIQQGGNITADPMGRIGCCLVAEGTFFPEEQWVTAPSTWHPRIQSGTRMDLTQGEGLRVWRECQERAAQRVARDAPPPPQERYGAPVLHQPRLGQGIFRVHVLDAYARACAVTGEHSLPVLEAAHIKPYSNHGEHTISNGLSLRTDIHRLFDCGYLTIDDEHKLVVGERLRRDFSNGKTYYGLHGRALTLPEKRLAWPDPGLLAWHREEKFLG